MNPFPYFLAGLLIGGGLLLTLAGCRTPAENASPVPVDFTTQIRPLLEGRCLECHHTAQAPASGGLSLETRHAALSTGRHAPVILPGNGAGSLLYRVLAVEDTHPQFMPPTPDRFWTEPKALIRRWIDEGAAWPEGEEGRLVPPQHWARENGGRP